MPTTNGSNRNNNNNNNNNSIEVTIVDYTTNLFTNKGYQGVKKNISGVIEGNVKNNKNSQFQNITQPNDVKQQSPSDYMTDALFTNPDELNKTQDALKRLSHDDESKELRKLMRAAGIFDSANMDYNTKCYKYPRIDPYNFIDGAKEYVFITKVDLPMLNAQGNGLASEMAFFPYLHDLWNSGYIMSVFANLCTSIDHNILSAPTEKNYPFMRILSNRKTSNLDLPDINAEELESPTNLFGSKIIYYKSSALSDENPEFSLEFEDTKYLEIYNLFKAYDYYRQGKWLGVFGPGVHANAASSSPVFAKYLSYIPRKILYDHMSVYKFLVASDGSTILYGVKFTGCFPKSISRSALSELDEKGGLKITVNFKVSGWMTEDMVEIARDFNCIIYNYAKVNFMSNSFSSEPIYDDTIDRVSQESVDFPYIRRYPEGSIIASLEKPCKFSRYHLLWGNKPGAPESVD